MLPSLFAFAITMIASRIGGLLRDIGIASKFGLSQSSDLAILITTVPDLVVSWTIAGGLSGVVVPALAAAKPGDRTKILKETIWVLLPFMMAISLLLVAFPEIILIVLAPGLDVTHTSDFFLALRVSVAAIFILGVVALRTADLESQKQAYYGPLAASAYTFTVASFLFASIYLEMGEADTLIWLSYFVIFGASIRLIVLFNQKSNLKQILLEKFSSKLKRLFWKDFILASVSLLLITAIPIFFRTLYSLKGVGTLTEFTLALRLIDLGVGLASASLATVAMPHIARYVKRNTIDQQRELVGVLLKISFISGLTFSSILIINSNWIVQLIFVWKAATPDAFENVSAILQILAIGVPGIFIQSILIMILHSAQKAKVVIVSITKSILITLISIIFAWMLTENLNICVYLGFFLQPVAASYLMFERLDLYNDADSRLESGAIISITIWVCICLVYLFSTRLSSHIWVGILLSGLVMTYQSFQLLPSIKYLSKLKNERINSAN